MTLPLTNLQPIVGLPLLRFINERRRQKKPRIEEIKIPNGITGYAVALLDCDLICTQSELNPIQKRTTQLHEMDYFTQGEENDTTID